MVNHIYPLYLDLLILIYICLFILTFVLLDTDLSYLVRLDNVHRELF